VHSFNGHVRFLLNRDWLNNLKILLASVQIVHT